MIFMESFSEDDADEGASVLGSIMVFVQSVIGGGLLAYPYAYKNAGIVPMAVIQMSLVTFVALGLITLGWLGEKTKADTFQGLVRHILGREAELFCETVMLLLLFGACVVYVDICADQVAPMFPHDTIPRWAVTVSLVGLLFLLSLVKSLAVLSIPSTVGSLAMLFAAGIVMVNCVLGGCNTGANPRLWSDSTMDLITAVPTVCFGYQGHISAVPLFAELKKPSQRKWALVWGIGLLACVVIYNTCGLAGYATFGETVDSDCLKNFESDGGTSRVQINNTELWITRAGLASCVAVSFAVMTFCGRSCILNEWSLAASKRAKSKLDTDEIGDTRLGAEPSWRHWICITGVWSVLVGAIAVAIPSIGKLISVVGNLAAFFMFIFPGMCVTVTIARDVNVSECLDRHLLAGTTLAPDASPLESTTLVTLVRHAFNSKSTTTRQRLQLWFGLILATLGILVFVVGLVISLINA